MSKVGSLLPFTKNALVQSLSATKNAPFAATNIRSIHGIHRQIEIIVERRQLCCQHFVQAAGSIALPLFVFGSTVALHVRARHRCNSIGNSEVRIRLRGGMLSRRTQKISYFVAKLSGLKKIFFRGTYICGHAKTMDKISRALKYWSKGEVQITFLCHEGFMGTFGAFWSYENMGIHDLAANDFIKEVLLSAPYMLGKAQVSPTMNLNMKSKSSLSEEVQRLKQENIELGAELERLKQENIDLKFTLSKLQNSNEARREHEDMYTFTADKGQ